MRTKNKLSIMVSMALLATPLLANEYIIKANVDIDSEAINSEITYTEWKIIEDSQSCPDWAPLTNTVLSGQDFEQSRTCSETKERIATYSEIDSFSGIKTIIKTETETQVFSNPLTQLTQGTGNPKTCSEAAEMGATQSGTFLLDGPGSAYCELNFNGSNYRRIVSNMYDNGDFAGGVKASQEMPAESNPTNTMISMKTPVGSYAIHQTGSSIHEYQLSMYTDDLTQHEAGRYASLSLWVINKDLRMTHNRFYYSDGAHIADGGDSKVVASQVVDGRTWYKIRYIVKLQKSNPTLHNWYVGYKSGGDNYFSGLSHELFIKD